MSLSISSAQIEPACPHDLSLPHIDVHACKRPNMAGHALPLMRTTSASRRVDIRAPQGRLPSSDAAITARSPRVQQMGTGACH